MNPLEYLIFINTNTSKRVLVVVLFKNISKVFSYVNIELISGVQGSYLPIWVDNKINVVIKQPFLYTFWVIKLFNGGEYLCVSPRKVSLKSTPCIQVIGRFVYLVKFEKLQQNQSSCGTFTV